MLGAFILISNGLLRCLISHLILQGIKVLRRLMHGVLIRVRIHAHFGFDTVHPRGHVRRGIVIPAIYIYHPHVMIIRR